MKMLLALLMITTSLFAQTNDAKALRKQKRLERREERVKSRRDDNLSKVSNPKFYSKRDKPILNIALVYYGDHYTEDDLSRVQALLETRFAKATAELVTLNIVVKAVLPFKSQLENFPEYRQQYVTEPDRLQRLWYYDNVGARIINEVYEQVKANPDLKPTLSSIDSLVIVTGAQFDALGFASGRVAVTENPMEIAWGLPDGGRVEFVTDEKVVDELIHEIGHVMFLDHASNQCQKPGMTYKETLECCKTSPAKDDVMSYCRSRAKVDAEFFYGFAECNLRTIKDKIVPAMLEGKAWNISDREKCL
jgi:hypothetical protein